MRRWPPTYATVLAEPDDQLAAYQMLGPEGLAEFADQFAADPVAVTREYFGEPEIERRPELAELADIRVAGLDADSDESGDSAEVDATIGDAPGTADALPSSGRRRRQASGGCRLSDRIHVHTPVQGRRARPASLPRSRAGCVVDRMEGDEGTTQDPQRDCEPGCARASTSWSIIYDSFESWMQIAAGDATHDRGHALRDALDAADVAVFVFLVDEGVAPELEEQFGAGTHARWDFPGLARFEDAPDELRRDLVDSWLEAATISGAAP